MAFEAKGTNASLFSSLGARATLSQHVPEGTEAEADHAIKVWRHYLWFVVGQPPLFWDLWTWCHASGYILTQFIVKEI